MRIGMLTGGGDCPGLNAVIRAVVRKGEGDLRPPDHRVPPRLARRARRRDGASSRVASTRGLIHRGGTILGTSRTNPFKIDDGLARVLDTLARERIDALIVDRRRGHARRRRAARRRRRAPSSACRRPSTTTSSATDFTFGFQTAVQIATDAIDRLHTTAESHDRVMVVEVMGRHAGWIAIVLGHRRRRRHRPRAREPFDIAEVCERIEHRHAHGVELLDRRGRRGRGARGGHASRLQSGEVDEFGHVRLGGISNVVAEEIERRTGFETRVTILGHVLRGGTPTAYDRVLATRFGIAAIDAAHEGDFGTMVALRGSTSSACRSTTRCASSKTVDPELVESPSVFFG